MQIKVIGCVREGKMKIINHLKIDYLLYYFEFTH